MKTNKGLQKRIMMKNASFSFSCHYFGFIKIEYMTVLLVLLLLNFFQFSLIIL